MAKMLNNTAFSEVIYRNKMNELDNLRDELRNSGLELCKQLGVKWNTPEEAKEISIEHIQEDMQKIREREQERYNAISFCDNDYLLNMEDRHKELIKLWTPYLLRYRTALNRTLKEEIGIKVDSNGAVWMNEKDMKAAATKAATVQWNPQDKELYTLLGELAEVLNKIHDVEYVNYTVLLKYILADRKKPENDAFLLGEVKGFSITPDKLLDIRINQNYNVLGGNYCGVHQVSVNDIII